MNEEEVTYLARWAARYGAALQLEGEVGFGRPCVGITKGDHYPAWSDYDLEWRKVPAWVDPNAAPPEGVTDAYHKSECLAVLGHGDDPIHQLYLWVKNLDEHGIGIILIPREPTSQMDALFHGVQQAILTKVAS